MSGAVIDKFSLGTATFTEEQIETMTIVSS